jgi:hypothetical protein
VRCCLLHFQKPACNRLPSAVRPRSQKNIVREDSTVFEYYIRGHIPGSRHNLPGAQCIACHCALRSRQRVDTICARSSNPIRSGRYRVFAAARVCRPSVPEDLESNVRMHGKLLPVVRLPRASSNAPPAPGPRLRTACDTKRKEKTKH